MSQIGKVVEEIKQPRKVFVYLKRTPTKKEVQIIKNVCLSLSTDETQPAIREIDDVGGVISREIEQEEHAKIIKRGDRFSSFGPLIYNKEDLTIPKRFKLFRRPYSFILSMGFSGFPKVYVFHAFNDERAERIINKEKDQLSPHERNMIALDVTHVSSTLKYFIKH